MLLYPAMNDLLEQVPSRYKLVNVVAARARQIAVEAEAHELVLEDKTVSIAVREIAEGRLPLDFLNQEPAEEARAEMPKEIAGFTFDLDGEEQDYELDEEAEEE